MCVCVLCTTRIRWLSWRGSHAIDFWQHWMLQVITYNPLIPSFISCSAQTLCNRAPPFHPLSFHLITYFLMFFLHLSTLFHFWNNWTLCLPHGDCIVGASFHSLKQMSTIFVFHLELALWVMKIFIIVVEGEVVF